MLAVVIWLHTSPLSVWIVRAVLKEGRARRSDLGGCSTTTDVTNAVVEKLARPYHTPGTSR